MASKTLYFYKSVYAEHNSIFNGGEVSISSGSTSAIAEQKAMISIWVDTTAIKNLDIKSIDSVTLSYQCKTTTNSSINYSYLKYKAKTSGSDADKVGKTETSKLPTSYTTRTHGLGTWTKDELCAGDGAHIYLYVYMAVPWLTNSTVNLKDVKLIVNYTLNSYTLTVNSTTGGTATGGGTYESGQTVTISAIENDGYSFKKWSDGNTSNPRTITVSGNATYTAYFEPITHTVNFKNDAGTTLNTYQITPGSLLTQIPETSKTGYDFVGWIPCAPAKKTDGSVLDSQQYTGESNSFAALSKDYKYTDKLAVHIDAYMSDWSNLSGTSKQIISCTQSGGWAIGMYAGGTEINTAGSYTSIDLGLTSLTSGWHSFDIVFTNGLFTAYVDGQKKGEKTTSATLIQYHPDNTIFVGGEAGTSDSIVENSSMNFVGLISNVFIANQGSKLDFATTSTKINASVDYYPVWRIKPTEKKKQIYVGDKQVNKIYIGDKLVKEVYIGDIKIYG